MVLRNTWIQIEIIGKNKVVKCIYTVAANCRFVRYKITIEYNF